MSNLSTVPGSHMYLDRALGTLDSVLPLEYLIATLKVSELGIGKGRFRGFFSVIETRLGIVSVI
jgi:hypothetical protein